MASASSRASPSSPPGRLRIGQQLRPGQDLLPAEAGQIQAARPVAHRGQARQRKGIAQRHLRVGRSPGAELLIAGAARGVQPPQGRQPLQQGRLPRLENDTQLLCVGGDGAGREGDLRRVLRRRRRRVRGLCCVRGFCCARLLRPDRPALRFPGRLVRDRAGAGAQRQEQAEQERENQIFPHGTPPPPLSVRIRTASRRGDRSARRG